ncbi:hypothetical protein [Actinacidiphila oryziradicis]|uniref:Uncharacterized protein n=1 Tax=Actinacidiphila oryziradicis TaxID=2571141 RepID=A0A4U0RIZ6_9ACTN|nr:hypothetical protein [Actinacidiphila oryziradicis]TJZ95649.1 hypothetical protein FCI23_51995 [Actinacidiphila oryziradicis]
MTVRVESNSYLTEEQQRVYQLRSSLERNGGTPGGFLDLLAAVVSDGTWRQVPAGVNADAPFTSFSDFIEAKPPFGLGHKPEYVLKVLQVPHPHEGVPEIRKRMNAMRAEVQKMLAQEGITGYSEEQRDRDITAWAALDRSGGWWLAFFVACQVSKGADGNRNSAGNGKADGLPKISAAEFARRSRTSAERVLRYLRAWEAAKEAGVVQLGAADLRPGNDPMELPSDEVWGRFYGPRNGAASERGALIAAAAEVAGIRPTKALEVKENPTALKVAIIADQRTAEAAKEALDVRAAEARKVERAQYVRQVAGDGKAKTPAGLPIELPAQAKAKAAAYVAVVEDEKATPEAVAEAYEAVQALIVETVASDPEITIREQRTRFTKTLTSTVRSIESIDPDDLLAVADDGLRASIVAAQKRINELADLLAPPASSHRDA